VRRLLPSPLLLVAILAAAPATPVPPAPAEVPVSFDPDLARPDDRAAYERTLREMVRDARARAAAGLGMEPDPGIKVRVHSRAAYEREFGAEAAGHDAASFRGEVIHLNGGARLDDRVAGLLVHEMVHAALDAGVRARQLPRWLDEGLAERLGRRMRGLEAPSPGQVAELRQAREARRLVPLPRDGELDPFGYLRCWAAVVFLEQRSGRERVMAVVRATLGGEEFERALRRETGLSQEDVDREFEAWVGKL
jgi:hypothetical protein